MMPCSASRSSPSSPTASHGMRANPVLPASTASSMVATVAVVAGLPLGLLCRRLAIELPFIAFALLKLTPHLEAGAKPDARLERITIRDLLTHTSGLGYAQIGSAEANAIYARAGIIDGFDGQKGHLLATDMKKLGVNTIFIQKFPWGGANPSNWWKYIQRPNPKIEEAKIIEQRSVYAKNVSYSCFTGSKVEYENNSLDNVIWYGVTESFDKIQDVEIGFGRYISQSEFLQGTNVVVLGYENAVKLFDKPERAIDKVIQLGEYRSRVIGVTKKKGRSLVGGWDFDNHAEPTASTSLILRFSNGTTRAVGLKSADMGKLQKLKPGLRAGPWMAPGRRPCTA